MRFTQPHFQPAPLALAAALAVLSPMIAQAQSAADSGKSISFSINSQPLGSALNELAAASGTSIGFAPALVAGKTARPVHGALTLKQAVEQMLAGSGLVAVTQGGGLIIKAIASNDDSASLATVTVTAQLERDGVTEGSGSYTQTGPSRTATGLNLSLRETPQSVTVMTRQRMDDFKLETLTDVMEQTPGIAVYRQNNATDFQARGAKVNLQTDGMAQLSSGWYYLTSTMFSLDDMAEIDRIEVLKGSSGLVVGKGDYGATVNMIRKRPTREFQASVRANAGSWDTYRTQADVSGPLNEAGTVRGRLVASAMDEIGRAHV